MEPEEASAPDQEILHLLQPGERVALGVAATNEELRVTDRRLIVTTAGHVRLDIPYQRLRRIEFDIEAGRPTTMVIVPALPSDEPQVLSRGRACTWRQSCLPSWGSDSSDPVS